VELGVGIVLCPDLAVVMRVNGRLWLAAEVIQAGDHQPDTVLKKSLYEDLRIPRLWIVDPRYDNVEVYHATAYGLMLKGILASRETLNEPVLAGFSYSIRELFTEQSPASAQGGAG
jgi:Uma2 family endonuclease